VPRVPEEALQAVEKALVPYDFDNPLFLVRLAFLHAGYACFLQARYLKKLAALTQTHTFSFPLGLQK